MKILKKIRNGFKRKETWALFTLCLICQLAIVAHTYATNKNMVQITEEKTLDLLTRIDAFSQNDPRLMEDSAKAHYNMGNIYFQKGEYKLAAKQYAHALTLMPNDPDVHYNLAYVSGEYLNDYPTSLKHYKMYLYLKPNARDQKFVKEKILDAQLWIKGETNSKLERKY